MDPSFEDLLDEFATIPIIYLSKNYGDNLVFLHQNPFRNYFILETQDEQLKCGWMTIKSSITMQFHWQKMFLLEG